MLHIKTVIMKNFMSVGAVSQTVNLDKSGLTLVLGENLDMGGSGARNGVGKSSLLNAISYGLYGTPLTNIKKDNLVNKINQKNMSVTIDFEVNGHKYKIVRGRKPNFFQYIVDDKNVNTQDTDEAQGENKDTQYEIERLVGLSHNLFKHIVALSTYTEPFLNLGSGKQREIIEELLGITQLSKKAGILHDLNKITKINIEKEEFRIKTLKISNEKIYNTIKEFQLKVNNWDSTHVREIATIEAAIAQLEQLDIDVELAAHADADLYKELSTGIAQFNRELLTKKRHKSQLDTQLNGLLSQYEKASNNYCPVCSQGIKAHNHAAIIEDLEVKIAKLDTQVTAETTDIDELTTQLNTMTPVFNIMKKPQMFYSTYKEALNHKNTVNQLQKDLEKERNQLNPYTDQAETLSNTLQEVSYEDLNRLVKDREHQEFLLKLLTNKDSFIRKRIVDQNLTYLNKRLAEYLDKMGLPHVVKFLNDLSVEISFMGQDYDFSNLSRGEGSRVILALNLSFRDIFESTNAAIDLVFIDELLDQGMDSAGLECVIPVLNELVRERNKNIFVISHREELISRVNNTLTVLKENNFTRFEFDGD